MTAYRAIVERDDKAWNVTIAGLGGQVKLVARDLADVEPRVRKYIVDKMTDAAEDSDLEVEEFDLEVEVRLAPSTQVHLLAACKYSALVEAEYDAAIDALIDAGVPLLDVSRVLALYRRSPRPMTVTNAEIAERGLGQHLDAVGLEWDDHTVFRTRKCRDCVESTRREYRGLPPNGENALVYTANGFACDFCDVGHEESA